MRPLWTWFEYIGLSMVDLRLRIHFYDRRIARRMSRVFGRKFSKITVCGRNIYVFHPVTK